MLRRTFLATAAATLIPARLSASDQPYTPGLVDTELAAGKTVFVDFYTDWCLTCKAQGRAIKEVMQSNPAYDQQISFVRVDWDIYSKDPLSRRLRIPRRSTLVVLKGKRELGRIVAGTRKEDIKALMDAALTAASA